MNMQMLLRWQVRPQRQFIGLARKRFVTSLARLIRFAATGCRPTRSATGLRPVADLDVGRGPWVGAGVQATRGVPPVGVEPTLGTLLGGRPLPLGYGGSEMIPRAVQITHG